MPERSAGAVAVIDGGAYRRLFAWRLRCRPPGFPVLNESGVSVAQSRKLLLVGAVLGIFAGITLFVAHSHTYLDVSASDFAINRAAAQQLLDRDPVYDADAERDRLKHEGLYRGQLAAESFTGTYSNFIGLPTTALVYTPFANMNFDDALLTFQIVEVACFLGAVVIVGFAVPRRNRVLAWLVGLAALLLFFPVMSSLALGQVDGMVMLALAVAVWASARDKWALVGVALGVAVLLKISPWVVLAFVLLRVGRRCLRVAIGAASAVAVLLALSTLVGGRPHDIVTWLTDVVPTLSRGNRSVENQSVPALLARFLVGGDDLVATTIPIGGYRFVGYLIAVAGILGMWWWRRNRSFVPLELGALILIALLSGPISWSHYLTWAIIPLMLLADPRRFAGSALRTWTLAGVAAASCALLVLPVKYPSPAQVATNWWWRPYSGAGTVALLGLLAVTLVLLARDPLDEATDQAEVSLPPRVVDAR